MLCTSSVPTSHFFIYFPFSARICFSNLRRFEPKWWNESRDLWQIKKTKTKNWQDPETLMRQRILPSPCLWSAHLNPSSHCCFHSLFLRFHHSTDYCHQRKSKNRLHPGARIHICERQSGGKTFSFSQLEEEKWLESKTVTLLCFREFFMLQLSCTDGDYSS